MNLEINDITGEIRTGGKHFCLLAGETLTLHPLGLVLSKPAGPAVSISDYLRVLQGVRAEIDLLPNVPATLKDPIEEYIRALTQRLADEESMYDDVID